MNQTEIALLAVAALCLLLFGTLYALLVAYLHRRHYRHITAALLPLSVVGVGGPVLLSALVIGLGSALVVLGALAIAALPVAAIVGHEIVRTLDDQRIDL